MRQRYGNRFFKFLAPVGAIALAILLSATFGLNTCTSSEVNKYFKPSGKFNYAYDPGVILPLRNGKIIALGGAPHPTEPERLLQAADGNTYGLGGGMVELFDPDSQKTTVLTRMPFVFVNNVAAAANRRQMAAIELLDGRILMVGRFLANWPWEERFGTTWKPFPKLNRPRRFNDNFHFLPLYSTTEPKRQLKSIATKLRPNMFGLLYDPRDHSFEVVDSPDEIPPRWFVAMNLLSDGQVLITGGSITIDSSWKDFPETRVLIFNPQNKKLSVIGKLGHARLGHQVVPISKSKFLLFNGFGASDAEMKKKVCTFYNNDGSPRNYAPSSQTHEVEQFDLETGSSTVVGHTLTGRYDFSALRLPNNTVFIHGGAVGCMGGHDASELYNEKTGNCTYVGEHWPAKSQGFASHDEKVPYRLAGEGIDFRATAQGDRILLAGMDSAFIYDVKKLTDRQWLHEHNQPKHLLMPRYHHHIVKTTNGRVFVLGGLTFGRATAGSVQGERRADLIEEFVLIGTGDTNGQSK